MKTIKMTVPMEFFHLGTATVGYTIEEFAVNNDGSGLFSRPNDGASGGAWQQLAGTGQFHARSPAILARKVRAWSEPKSGAKMVRGSARGWDGE